MDVWKNCGAILKGPVLFFMMCLACGCAAPAYGGEIQPEIALRDDAPLYQGPVQEGDLEALALDDFEAFGNQAFLPEEQYRQYQKILLDPPADMLVPYRMKVIDRELTPNDFFGFSVSEELSNARYESYVSMNPETIGGRTIHYAYVYHPLLSLTGTDLHLPQRKRTDIFLRKEV